MSTLFLNVVRLILFSLILITSAYSYASWEVLRHGIKNSNHLINTTQILPAEYNQPIQLYSESHIRQLFPLVSRAKLPWEYIKDCCYDRGYYISQQLDLIGTQSIRVVVEGTFNEIYDKWGEKISWNTHTAPAIVDVTGKIWIFDPALHNEPLLLSVWLSLVISPTKPHAIYLAHQYLYSEHEINDQLKINSFDRKNVWEVVEGGLFGCQALQIRKSIRSENQPQTSQSLNCSIFSQSLKHAQDHQVSDFWAQKLVGLDLSRGLVEDLRKHKKIHQPIIHIWDSEMSAQPVAKNIFNHAFSVASFFKSGDHSSTNIAMIGQTQDVVGNENPHPAVIDNMPNSLFNVTQLVNMSASWGSYNSGVRSTIEKLADKNTVLVQANANHSRMNLNDITFEPEDDRFIRVGNLTPEGLRSHNSGHRYDKYVIYAPADTFITARAQIDGEYTRFAGTSGATPLVTGAIANLVAFNPRMSLTDITRYLSAHSLRIYGDNRIISYQILNSYGSLVHSLPFDVRSVVIQKNKNELPLAMNEIKNQYPDCVPNSYHVKLKQQTCGVIKESFNIIRKNFYIQPSVRLAELIACVYKKQNMNRESLFFQNWADSQENRLSIMLLKRNFDQLLVLRNIDLLSSTQADQLMSPITFEKISKKSEYLSAVFAHANTFSSQLKNIYSDLRESKDKKLLLNGAILFPKARRILYQLAAQDSSIEMRLASLDIFMNTQDKDLKKELLFLVDEKNERILNKLIYYLQYSDLETQRLVVERILNTNDENVQLMMLDQLSRVSKLHQKFVIEFCLKSNFKSVAKLAVEIKKNR